MVGVGKYLHLLGFLSALIFILWGCCPMVLLSILAFLCPPTWPHDENVYCPHLYHVITWPEMVSCTLMVGAVKYLHLLGVLSALIFILWGCCPMVLLSILAFLCPQTWPHDENVDCPHLYHVITLPAMGSCTLMVGVVKYLHLLGVLSAFIFILWGCCPIVLLSILAFLCPPTWPQWWECWLSTPVSCDHMTRNGIMHLDGWSSKIFASFGGFVRLDFYPLGLFSYGAFVHFGFSLYANVTAVTRMLIVHTCIMWSHDQKWVSCTLMVGVLKYLHLLGVLSALIFILWGCCPMVLLSILAFLSLPTWPHDENVDCPHLYHVITWPEMVSCTLMVGAVKYLHLLGVLSTLIFILWGCCPMVLLSILSFLCPPTWKSDENVDCPHLYHVITWPEMGLCTLMVGVLKYLHLLGVLSALIFILWGCCPVLLSILAFLCPPTWPSDENVDCLHLYHVITWPEMGSWTMMFGVAKYLHLLRVFVQPWFLSFGAVVLWCFCSILAFLCPPTWPHDENVDCPHLYHVITWPEMGSWTMMFLVAKYLHLLGFLSTLIFILWGCCPMVLLSILAFLCPC